jgi:hypothetical protein
MLDPSVRPCRGMTVTEKRDKVGSQRVLWVRSFGRSVVLSLFLAPAMPDLREPKKVNGPPFPSNQNRMIPSLFRRSYSRSSTLRIVLQGRLARHPIFAPTSIETPLHTEAAPCGAATGLRALGFLMPNASVHHARPLRAVVPELGRTEVAAVGEDYSEFLICR